MYVSWNCRIIDLCDFDQDIPSQDHQQRKRKEKGYLKTRGPTKRYR